MTGHSLWSRTDIEDELRPVGRQVYIDGELVMDDRHSHTTYSHLRTLTDLALTLERERRNRPTPKSVEIKVFWR